MKKKKHFVSLITGLFLICSISSFSQQFETEDEKIQYVGKQLAISLKNKYQLTDEQFEEAIKIETNYKKNASKAKKESDMNKRSLGLKNALEQRAKSLKKIMTEEQFKRFEIDQEKRYFMIKKE